MRLSADPSDPDFGPAAYKGKVFLDGVELAGGLCVTADEERGEVIVYKLDENGLPLIDHATESAVREVWRGVVRIEIPE